MHWIENKIIRLDSDKYFHHLSFFVIKFYHFFAQNKDNRAIKKYNTTELYQQPYKLKWAKYKQMGFLHNNIL